MIITRTCHQATAVYRSHSPLSLLSLSADALLLALSSPTFSAILEKTNLSSAAFSGSRPLLLTMLNPRSTYLSSSYQLTSLSHIGCVFFPCTKAAWHIKGLQLASRCSGKHCQCLLGSIGAVKEGLRTLQFSTSFEATCSLLAMCWNDIWLCISQGLRCLYFSSGPFA